MHADPDLHPHVIETLLRYCSPRATVLDLGAGAGAMSLRMTDAGYQVTPLDIDEGKWALDTLKLHKLDLNAGVVESVGSTFDAVVCLEVVEHIENPWQLLRDIRSLLVPGGYAFVSTPNITSFYSRLYFLRTGRYHHFEPGSESYGHVGPITHWQVQMAAEAAGLEVVDLEPVGTLPMFDLSGRQPRRLIGGLLNPIVYALANGQKHGNLLLFVLHRPQAASPTHPGVERAER